MEIPMQNTEWIKGKAPRGALPYGFRYLLLKDDAIKVSLFFGNGKPKRCKLFFSCIKICDVLPKIS